MPSNHNPPPIHGLNEEEALLSILEGTATETGERFFQALVKNLAKALQTHGAWVTEYFPETRRLKALAFWLGGDWLEGWEMNITGTPCEAVIDNARLVHFPDNLLNLYPNDPDVINVQAVSYMGMPLTTNNGTILGHLAVLDTKPMPDKPKVHALIRIFAARAAAELQRVRAELEVKEREEKLGRLVDSAMDAIIELSHTFCVTRMNPAAEKVFQCQAQHTYGQDFSVFLSPEDNDKLQRLIKELDSRPENQRYQWIPDGLTPLRVDGTTFPAEATLSRYQMQRETFHTLILRNVYDRLEAKQKIHSLTIETENLKEELKVIGSGDDIIGESEALIQVLQEIQQVAKTDATVLILGETGTGKEVMARAIHSSSSRKSHPFIKVNCAAIPGNLIESEFFGHEQGAFTGATKKREGRFSLAHGGTIFLDEVGELPLELQSKLLRVLQEGEFEPVGSSQTQKVNIRVLAATNRDLQKEAMTGKFREDLFYRLNVFPITVPPLRDRGEDIVCLATHFATRYAQRMGRTLLPLSPDRIQRLTSYNWPGNVRELQNVMERAVITSMDGHLNLERALPDTVFPLSGKGESPPSFETEGIRTIQDLEKLEKANIIRALEATNGKVAGENGAARLLGMKQSTLASRIKTLGISRQLKEI
jgi:PAS domain S-box-containing protein